jgi:hypothetical protein
VILWQLMTIALHLQRIANHDPGLVCNIAFVILDQALLAAR